MIYIQKIKFYFTSFEKRLTNSQHNDCKIGGKYASISLESNVQKNMMILINLSWFIFKRIIPQVRLIFKYYVTMDVFNVHLNLSSRHYKNTPIKNNQYLKRAF